LENRIKELEKKLETSTSSNAISPAVESKPNKPIEKVTQPVVNTKTQTTASVIDTEALYKDVVNKYTDFKSQVENDIATLKPMASPILIKRRDYMNNFSLNLDYEMRGLNNLSSKSQQNLSFYSDKLIKLKDEYRSTLSNYLDEYNQAQEDSARKIVVDYIKINKYSLYLTAKHITAATMFDLYDRLFNTKYAEGFRLTKTQTETVEFANSFLLDLGESVTD